MNIDKLNIGYWQSKKGQAKELTQTKTQGSKTQEPQSGSPQLVSQSRLLQPGFRKARESGAGEAEGQSMGSDAGKGFSSTLSQRLHPVCYIWKVTGAGYRAHSQRFSTSGSC